MITKADRFTRLWPLFAGALILAFAVAAHAEEPTDSAIPAPTEVTPPPPPPSTPVVRVNMIAGTICTGFYVGDDLVVTAGHCVRGQPNGDFTVVADNGASYVARVAAFSNLDLGLEDWALLNINNRGKPEVPGGWAAAKLDCSHKLPAIGTEIRAEGFPGSEESQFRVTFGRVSGVTAIVSRWAYPMMHLQLLVAKGNSGGPVIRQSDGAVLGIVVAYNSEYPEFSVANPIGVICDLLHKNF